MKRLEKDIMLSKKNQNKEKYRNMLTYIDEYKQNKITARDLMFYLECLINSLYEIDKNHNLDLHIVYTHLEVSLVIHDEISDTEEKKLKALIRVQNNLNEIIKLINQKLIPQK